MSSFVPCTPVEVAKLLSSSSKSSHQDFIPTSFVKSCSFIFSLLISTFTNLSMSQGCFPNSFKIAQVSPLLKKIGLNKDNPSTYRPISNLNTISKLLEHLILICVQDHTTSSTNFNPFQSAYQNIHSTETALLSNPRLYLPLLTKVHSQSSSPSISVPPLTPSITRYSSTDSTLAMVSLM